MTNNRHSDSDERLRASLAMHMYLKDHGINAQLALCDALVDLFRSIFGDDHDFRNQ